MIQKLDGSREGGKVAVITKGTSEKVGPTTFSLFYVRSILTESARHYVHDIFWEHYSVML